MRNNAINCKIVPILSMKEFDMELKSTLFSGVLAASLAVPAFANDAPVVAPLPQFTTADAQMLFEQDAMPMNWLRCLSRK